MITSPRSVTGLLLAASLVALLPLAAVQAADEDMSSSVYLKFDPETGDFVTVEDPSRTRSQQSQQHQAASQSQQPAASTSQPATDPAQGGTTAAAAAQSDQALPVSTDGGAAASPTVIATVIVLLALLAGAVLWLKRSPEKGVT